MTPYSQISQNKTKTILIMLIFIVLFSGFFYLIGKYFNSPGAYFVLGLIISSFSSLGSYFYSDKIVLFTTGARPAGKKEFFDFYTTTENLVLAAGLPMPKLYIIDDPSPNAFATGRDPKHAVVCATTGLLKNLDRSDIEGVISHELSHVKNYDILVSSIVAVLVGTLAIISNWLMRRMWWGRSDDNDNSSRSPIFALLLILSLIITPIVATLIQLAISRRREFLADASGVLITRNPEGLASALEKIATYPPLRNASPSTAHLFIVNPFSSKGRSTSGRKNNSWLINLFSTHPPIEERIRILRSM